MSNLKGVIIDAGHGGVDAGAVSDGIYEKDLNLKISLEMYNELKSLGVPVYLTRNSDESLTPSERVKKALSYFGNDSNVIIISNHINAGGGSGSEVIYSIRNNSILANKILNKLGDAGLKMRKVYQKTLLNNPNKDYYFMLRDTANTESLIVEYGFIDNANDRNLLVNNYKKYASSVVDAILDYIGYSSIYIVKSGDTLYGIAKKFNITVDELKSLNNLTSNLISINQKLIVPSSVTYKIKSGDTLYSIAKKYNTTVNDLMKKNNLKSTVLSIGQTLYI